MEAHEALRRHEEITEAGGHGHGDDEAPRNGLAQHAAVTVAIIAAFLAVATFMASEATKAVITKETQAAETSARLEANETKTTIADSNAMLFRVIGADSSKQAEAIAKAEALDEQVVKELGPIDRELNAEIKADYHDQDHAEEQALFFELSEVALQIGIVLAGVAILARRRWLLSGSGLVATAGVSLLAVGALY